MTMGVPPGIDNSLTTITFTSNIHAFEREFTKIKRGLPPLRLEPIIQFTLILSSLRDFVTFFFLVPSTFTATHLLLHELKDKATKPHLEVAPNSFCGHCHHCPSDDDSLPLKAHAIDFSSLLYGHTLQLSLRLSSSSLSRLQLSDFPTRRTPHSYP
ncbi:hypothetical protein VNO77_04888 [Canavalia gladiata]|uniref:Uncharacterized protein n=1 Tax=Canavalia gladiata TaxID=3824 RepID=A0AAN9N2G7_CANGL